MQLKALVTIILLLHYIPSIAPQLFNCNLKYDVFQNGGLVDKRSYHFARTDCVHGAKHLRQRNIIFNIQQCFEGEVLQISWHYKHFYDISGTYRFRIDIFVPFEEIPSVCFNISGIKQVDDTSVHLSVPTDDCFQNQTYALLKLLLFSPNGDLVAKGSATIENCSICQCCKWLPVIDFVTDEDIINTTITLNQSTLPVRVVLHSKNDFWIQNQIIRRNGAMVGTQVYIVTFRKVPCDRNYKVVVYSKASQYEHCKPSGRKHIQVSHPGCLASTTASSTTAADPGPEPGPGPGISSTADADKEFAPSWVVIVIVTAGIIIVVAVTVLVYFVYKRHRNTEPVTEEPGQGNNNPSEPLPVEMVNMNHSSVALLALQGSLTDSGNGVIDTFNQLIEERSHFNVTNCSSQVAQDQLYANSGNFVKYLTNTCNTMVVLLTYNSNQETLSESPTARAFLTTYEARSQNFARFILFNLGTGEDCKLFFESQYRIRVNKVYNAYHRNVSDFNNMCDQFLRDLGIEQNDDISQYYLVERLHGHIFP